MSYTYIKRTGFGCLLPCIHSLTGLGSKVAHVDAWIQDDDRSELGVLAHCQGQLAKEPKVDGVAELDPNPTEWVDAGHFGAC